MNNSKVRYNALQEEHIDHAYALGRGWRCRLALWLFPKIITGFTKTLIGRASERSLINSESFHEMMAMADRMVDSKRTSLLNSFDSCRPIAR